MIKSTSLDGLTHGAAAPIDSLALHASRGRVVGLLHQAFHKVCEV